MFRDNAITPGADQQDKLGEFPKEVFSRFYQEGWMYYFIPETDEENPGSFLVDSACVAEELAYGCAGMRSEQPAGGD